MNLSFGFTLSQTLCCPVCQQAHDPERAEEDTLDVILFGQVPFATCPRCHLKVSDPEDEKYLKKANDFFESGDDPRKEPTP